MVHFPFFSTSQTKRSKPIRGKGFETIDSATSNLWRRDKIKKNGIFLRRVVGVWPTIKKPKVDSRREIKIRNANRGPHFYPKERSKKTMTFLLGADWWGEPRSISPVQHKRDWKGDVWNVVNQCQFYAFNRTKCVMVTYRIGDVGLIQEEKHTRVLQSHPIIHNTFTLDFSMHWIVFVSLDSQAIISYVWMAFVTSSS